MSLSISTAAQLPWRVLIFSRLEDNVSSCLVTVPESMPSTKLASANHLSSSAGDHKGDIQMSEKKYRAVSFQLPEDVVEIYEELQR